MIKSTATVFVSDQLALLCETVPGLPNLSEEAEYDLTLYEFGTLAGSRVILLKGEDPRETVKNVLRYDLMRRFDTVAIYKQEHQGFEILSCKNSRFARGEVIKLAEIMPERKRIVNGK